MPHQMKIATCCYCGKRAALVLKGDQRHELVCSGCGAPLHRLKMMPSATGANLRESGKPAKHACKPVKSEPKAKKAPGAIPIPVRSRKSKSRKKKSVFRSVLSEAFDVIEDIFD